MTKLQDVDNLKEALLKDAPWLSSELDDDDIKGLIRGKYFSVARLKAASIEGLSTFVEISTAELIVKTLGGWNFVDYFICSLQRMASALECQNPGSLKHSGQLC